MIQKKRMTNNKMNLTNISVRIIKYLERFDLFIQSIFKVSGLIGGGVLTIAIMCLIFANVCPCLASHKFTVFNFVEAILSIKFQINN